MSRPVALASVGLPVRNGGPGIVDVIRSVLAQDYENLELVISDNASTDETEEICRQFARCEERIVYHRHQTMVGIQENFSTAMRVARGEFFRWIGDDDSLEPTYVSRCAEVLADDERLVLVSTAIRYELDDGSTATGHYERTGLRSDDPAVRFAECMWLLTQSYQLIDAMYSLVRRARVAPVPRLERMREDELFAARLALLGPWAHLTDVLATRRWPEQAPRQLARKLSAPIWTTYIDRELQAYRLWRLIDDAGLDRSQRRRARLAIASMEAARLRSRAANLSRRALARIGRGAGEP